MSGMRASCRDDEIEQPFLHDLEARQRHARELQARQRAELGQLDVLEFVQDLLGSEMNRDREREKGLGAAFDGLGRGPGHQQKDRIGLERCARRRPLRRGRDRALARRAAAAAVAATGVRKRQPTMLMPSIHGS